MKTSYCFTSTACIVNVRGAIGKQRHDRLRDNRNVFREENDEMAIGLDGRKQ